MPLHLFGQLDRPLPGRDGIANWLGRSSYRLTSGSDEWIVCEMAMQSRSFAGMLATEAVETNGLGSLLRTARYSSMAAISAGTLQKAPRRSRLLVRSPKTPSCAVTPARSTQSDSPRVLDLPLQHGELMAEGEHLGAELGVGARADEQ